MAVLIKDIAQQIGVSEATVSMALRNRSTISKARREEIQKLAQKMNYRPNRMAQGLARGKTKTIGLVIGTLQLEIAQKKAVCMDRIANAAGYKLFISYSKNEPERTLTLAEELIACGVDGLFIAGNNIPDDNTKLQKKFNFNIPTVFIDSKVPMEYCSNVVLHDKATGVEQAIDTLCELGHRQIYMLYSFWEYWWLDSRFTGFVEGLKRHNIDNPDNRIYKIDDQLCKLTDEPFQDINTPGEQNTNMIIAKNIDNFLQTHPDCTAIICSNDNVAIAITTYLLNRGIKVPEDISIVGIDNIPAARIIYPSLSTVSQPVDKVIETAFNIMIKCIKQPARPPEKVVIPTQFIRRKSCDKVRPLNQIKL